MLVHYLCCLLFLYIYGVYIWYIYGNMVYIYIHIEIFCIKFSNFWDFLLPVFFQDFFVWSLIIKN